MVFIVVNNGESLSGWWYTYPSGKRLQFAIEHGPFIVDLPTKDGDFP